MKRTTLACGLIALVHTLPVAAQITIDRSDFESWVGQHFDSRIHLMDAQHHGSLATLLNATGPDQTYDFTPFTYGTSIVNDFDVLSSASGTPGAGHPGLGGANFVLVSSRQGPYGGTTYQYTELRHDGQYRLGSVFVQATDYDNNGVLDSGFQILQPHDRLMFPLTIGSVWSQVFVGTDYGIADTSLFTITEEAAVEGWGMLITPAGSAPALRMRRTRTTEAAGVPPMRRTFIDFMTESMLSASIVRNEGDTVVLATYSDGTATTAVQEARQYSFRLQQNVPNPFSAATSIDFELQRSGYATLRVFDLMGREVGQLVDSHLPPGRHTIHLRSDGLVNGAYVYRLQVDDEVCVRLLVIEK